MDTLVTVFSSALLGATSQNVAKIAMECESNVDLDTLARRKCGCFTDRNVSAVQKNPPEDSASRSRKCEWILKEFSRESEIDIHRDKTRCECVKYDQVMSKQLFQESRMCSSSDD